MPIYILFSLLTHFILQECQDALMNCITQDLGFSEGKPVAAYTIFRCLVHWRSFETEKTIIFDRLIQMIGSAIEVIICLTLK